VSSFSGLVLVFVASLCLAVRTANGGFPEPFYINVDGRRTFVGDTDQPNSQTFTSILQSQLKNARIKFENHSKLFENRSTDISLAGSITFSIGDLPDMRLSTLRLIYTPEVPSKFGPPEGWDWKLHPEDASAIIDYYKKIEGPTYLRRQQLKSVRSWAPVLAYGATIVVLLIVIFWRQKNRLKREKISVSQEPLGIDDIANSA
jgi:hypothetical protein